MIGDRIRKFRKEKKWTQQDLALKSGYSQSNLSKMERSVTEITVSDLYKIANALGIKVTELLESEDEELKNKTA